MSIWEHISHRFFPIDKISRSIAFIDILHGMVHAKKVFGYPLYSGSIAANEAQKIFIRVPAGTYMHLQNIEIQCSDDVDIRIVRLDDDQYVPTGAKTNGSPRSSLGQTSSAVEVEPSSGTFAETFDLELAPSERILSGRQSVGRSGEGAEFVLGPGRDYLVTVANRGLSAAKISTHMLWYEV